MSARSPAFWQLWVSVSSPSDGWRIKKKKSCIMLKKILGRERLLVFFLLTFYEEIQRQLLTPLWWWKMAASIYQTKSVSVIWNAYLMLSLVNNRDTFTNIRTQTEDTNSLSWIRCSSSGPVTITTHYIVLKIFLVEGGWGVNVLLGSLSDGRNTDNPMTELFIRFCSTK